MVERMALIKIDVIQPESLQAVVARLGEVGA
jgi:hypothetical protein